MSKPTFMITRNQAEDLLNSYINDCINNESVAVPNIVGGTIKKDLLIKIRAFWKTFQLSANNLVPKRSLEIYRGLVAWSCWKEKTPIEDSDLFLAFEINNSIILDENIMQHPQHEILARPFEILRTDGSETASQILDTPSLVIDHPSEILRGYDYKSENVLLLKRNFDTNGPKDEQGKLFNNAEFALFENRKVLREVEDFLDQTNSEFVRYYFGLDKTKEINRIRVILVGVDKDGNNLLPPLGMSVEEIKRTNEPTILQTSWPPKGVG